MFFLYIVDSRREIVGTLSSQDGNAKEAFDKKCISALNWNLKNGCICLPSHTAPQLNFSLTYRRSVEFQMEIKIICRRGFASQTTQIVEISRCCFA